MKYLLPLLLLIFSSDASGYNHNPLRFWRSTTNFSIENTKIKPGNSDFSQTAFAEAQTAKASRQDSLPSQATVGGCAYSFSGFSNHFNFGGGNGSIIVTTDAGCNWSGVSNVSWIDISQTGTQTGSGTIAFTVQQNKGPYRRGTIIVAGQTFIVTQASGCRFTLPSETLQFPFQGGSGSFNVETGNNCAWTATTTVSWITITSGAGKGNNTVSFTVAAYTSGGSRIGMIVVNGQNFIIEQDGELQPPPRRAAFDFDGDGKSDFSIYRPEAGEWWYLRSSDSGNRAFQFGTASDKIVPADYTGDGKTDFAFYRPEKGEWFILRSEDFSYYSFPFGLDKDIPVPADYDGDGKADAAVFRPSTFIWYILKSTGGVTIQQFGTGEDIPVPADYNGDCKADIAVYNRSTSEWLVYYGNSVSIDSLFRENTSKPVPADYTGDGKADIALYDTLTNEWYVIRSENQTTYSVRFGAAEDIPAPGDYDGDRITDYAIYRPSTATWWYAASSANNQHRARQFGIGTDLPVPSAYIR